MSKECDDISKEEVVNNVLKEYDDMKEEVVNNVLKEYYDLWY